MMGSLCINCLWSSRFDHKQITILFPGKRGSTFTGGKFIHLYNAYKVVPTIRSHHAQFNTRSFVRRSVKRSKRNEHFERDSHSSENDSVQDDISQPVFSEASGNSSIVPSRKAVIQACTVTSSLMAALGIVIRQVFHVASTKGFSLVDISMEVSFGFETWHLQLIMEQVLLISSCRCLLLKTWPDFAKSSEAANRQVLTSLQPLDYIVVAFLPGLSEELLFRGALLPLFGFNWTGTLATALIFGVLHLGSGRKSSFAAWATFVGLVYGYATVVSSSIVVPMASHALNNLIGGILWRYTSNMSK